MLHQSLPSWTYTSEEYFCLEAEVLFKRSWQLVCHLNDIPDVGDYFTLPFLGQNIFVIKTKDGGVNGFHNVCRHRAARLLDGDQGNAKAGLVCPYHAWCYNLDGALTGVPRSHSLKDMDRSQYGLKPVEVEVWQGFIFIRMVNDGGPSVAEQFVECMRDIAPHQFENLQPLGRVTMRPRDVNWKQVADNYVDALHIPVAHPGLNSLFNGTYGVHIKGDVHIMYGDLETSVRDSVSGRAYKKFLPDGGHLPESLKRKWIYFRMWPNLAFDVYPDQVDFMQFIPISATQTMIREIPYALMDDRREMRAARYLNWRVNRQVNAEDTDLINRVQDGMASISYDQGPLSDEETLLIDSANRTRQQLPIVNEVVKPSRDTLLGLIEKEERYNKYGKSV